MPKKSKPAAARTEAKPVAQTAPIARLDIVDTLRGVAIAMMFAYHFCFDLAFFRVTSWNFYEDARWIAWRTVILSSFLLLVGIGLALAAGSTSGAPAARPRWPRYWQRLGQIAACALLVSVGSYFVFPQSWIYFGVLHHIAVASVLALPFLRAPNLALAIGIACVALGALVKAAAFDAAALQWIGLMTFKPRTEDYVPLLPWFGMVLVGIFIGERLGQAQNRARLARWRARNALTRTLAYAGRHSLLLYMLHQPVFIGLLMLVKGAPAM